MNNKQEYHSRNNKTKAPQNRSYLSMQTPLVLNRNFPSRQHLINIQKEPNTHLQFQLELEHNQYLQLKLIDILTARLYELKSQNLYDNRLTIDVNNLNIKVNNLKSYLKNQKIKIDLSTNVIDLIQKSGQTKFNILHLLQHKINIYKSILKTLIPVKNKNIVDYNNEKFNHLLLSMCNSLKCLSTYYVKSQIKQLKDIFDDIENSNGDLYNYNQYSYYNPRLNEQ